MRSLKFAYRSDVNLFTDPVFAPFKSRLDEVTKELQASGQHAARKEEIVTSNTEDQTSLQGVLGDHSPQTRQKKKSCTMPTHPTQSDVQPKTQTV